MDKEREQFVNTLVAVADHAHPAASRLALVACGDIEPREPMVHVMDEDVSLDATGYREVFLGRFLRAGYNQKHLEASFSFEKEEVNILPSPDRYQLANIISEEYQFPLSSAAKILMACCRLQHFPIVHQSLIGLTASYYKSGGTPPRTYYLDGIHLPAIIILVSDDFDLEDAILFWNLRANGFYVAWSSFSMLQDDSEAVVKWLDSDYGGVFYWMSTGSTIAFSTAGKDFLRLEAIVSNLQKKRQQSYPEWSIITHNDLIFYNYIQPAIMQDRVIVMNASSKFIFIPKLPQEIRNGIYTVTLEWNCSMFPRNSKLIYDKVSSDTIQGFKPVRESEHKFTNQGIVTLRFRTTKEHYLKIQVEAERPIEFNRPLPDQMVDTLFDLASFPRIERSSAATYHTTFINRAGSLDNAAYYLATSPYRELFDVLSDNSTKNRPGWILDNPSKRRVLHHWYLREVLGRPTPSQTKEYIDTVSDELPDEAIHLLEKSLLERGFRLKCHLCSFHSWYPAERVGQTFECARCFQTQVYDTNPLWLYKLPEVIFQGFEDNMQVPLLALNRLKHMSQHYFEWIPDSNVYRQTDDNRPLGNIDIICISDGRLCVGEAKSNDEIDKDQFSFYEQICRTVMPDGIVFATSKPQWNRGTGQRIDKLKTWFTTGEILILTEKDLYNSTSTF